MSHFDDLFLIRTILPNTSGAYVLRVFPKGAQRLSILAWRMTWTRVDARQPIDKYHRTFESCLVEPVLVEDDYGEDNGFRDLLVDHGRWSDIDVADFDTADAAIAHCREQLRKESC